MRVTEAECLQKGNEVENPFLFSHSVYSVYTMYVGLPFALISLKAMVKPKRNGQAL